MNAFISRLGVEHPIVQGPFGGGLSSVKLAAVVSNAGGLGSFGAHHLSPTQMREVIRDLQSATAKPFNINLWVSRYDPGAEEMTAAHHEDGLRQFGAIYERLGIEAPPMEPPDDFSFEEQAEVILETRPAVFSFVFGIPDVGILRECTRRGIVTVGTATTQEEAAALLLQQFLGGQVELILTRFARPSGCLPQSISASLRFLCMDVGVFGQGEFDDGFLADLQRRRPMVGFSSGSFTSREVGGGYE